MGLEFSGSFALGSMGWANAMIFIILSRLPNEMSWLYFGQLKGGNFFFLMCLICFYF